MTVDDLVFASDQPDTLFDGGFHKVPLRNLELKDFSVLQAES